MRTACRRGVRWVSAAAVIVTAVLTLPIHRAEALELDRELLARAKAEANILWRRGFTMEDSALTVPLQQLLDSLVADREVHEAIHLKVHVFRSPEINAFALPDGSIYMFVGMLSRMNSWDQLAFVLGHEAQHSIGWHGQRFIESAKTKSVIFTALSVGLSAALGSSGASGAPLIDALGQLGLGLAAAVSVNGYGRELEREADEASVSMLGDAGYDACAGAEALHILYNEYGDPSQLANLFWGNHPRLTERIADIAEHESRTCDIDTLSLEDSYEPIKWAATKLEAELHLDDEVYDLSARAARRYLGVFPDDPDMHCVLGESLAGGSPDSLDQAVRELERARELAPDDYRRPLLGLAEVALARSDTSAYIHYLDAYLADGAKVPHRRSLRRLLREIRELFPTTADQ